MSLIHSNLEDFLVIGINHWNATVPVREKFSLSDNQKKAILTDADNQCLRNVIVLSTCNRTEIYAITSEEKALKQLLLSHSNGNMEEFEQYGFVKKGEEAARHLYDVTVGLDAQILGDLQIVKQVKEAYSLARKFDLIDGEMHRLLQSVFRAHKRVRHDTNLGYGAASVAYAAVQFARNHLNDLHNKNILLIGTGKIGKVTCKNLVSLGASRLTLINRNHDRAEDLAGKYDLNVSTFDKLEEEVIQADLIIVATGAEKPVLDVSHFNFHKNGHERVLLDLSVPRNIHPEVESIKGVKLANMDQLSDETNETYKKREESVPAAQKIIDEEFTSYKQWLEEQKVVPTIIALNNKFDSIRQQELEKYKHHFPEESIEKLELITRRIINKIAAHSIDHLKENQGNPDEVKDMVESMFKLNEEKEFE
ncbi:MAG TPA: glutamyl-tRNA reductase [Balneolales bacterium]|nr:glutamyl-tRNA reductase [Balneolales bacterium]